MTTDSTGKRLDKIEIQLTPKEWAIRLADEQRQYRSAEECCKALVAETPKECLVTRAFDALKKQAEQRHPGNKPEDIILRSRLYEELEEEYHMLNLLQKTVSLAVADRAEHLGLCLALKFSQLHNLILQDATGRTSSPDDASLIEDWVDGFMPIMIKVFALQAGVKCVQDRHFDGHPILFRDWESKLRGMVDVVEEGLGILNVYIEAVDALITDNRGHEGHSEGTVSTGAGVRRGISGIDIVATKASAEAQGGTALADHWFEDAKEEAIQDFDEEAVGEWQAWHDRIRKHWGSPAAKPGQ